MKPESLVQLIGDGNTPTVEDEWMRLIEAPDLRTERFVDYGVVLTELCRVGQTARAEAYAWAALETISTRFTPRETLTVAGPFLLAVGESEDLRAQVLELYRTAYPDCEGLETLLAESGLGGGRPVRRALRTLEVALALTEGDYLAGRDEDAAARVDKIDRADWRITIAGRDGTETLDAVRLADRYRPASANEFWVMRLFAPEKLAKQMWEDPAATVIDICRQRDNRVDSDTIETILVPELLSEADWKKWWLRARTALKRCPHIKIEGRSPYYLTYVDQPIALEDGLLKEFRVLHDPIALLELVEKYVRECKAQDQEPCTDALRRCYDSLLKRVEKLTANAAPQAGLGWVVLHRAAEAAGVREGSDGAVNFFRSATNLARSFGEIEDNSLLDLACTCLVEARPDDWHQHLGTLLPTFPLAVCDRASGRLVNAGWGITEFEPVVQTILSSPVVHFEALLWLWDGPAKAEHIPVPPAGTLLSRIVRALDECRRSDSVPKETARKMSTRARAVLSARKYERFHQCLNDMDVGLGRALTRQIARLENLGRAVRDDLVSDLRRRFPPVESEPALQPWQRDDVIFVTRGGFLRKQEEIDHHVHVKMKENAKAIGRAAERGDLSENSEYKFALEERDLLRARLAQMNAEMAMARVVSPDEVPTDHAAIGTRVIFKRVGDGERYELSLVGPWETDAQKGWLNYQAPVAQKVLGLRIGDAIEFDHSAAVGTYEIVALENAFASNG